MGEVDQQLINPAWLLVDKVALRCYMFISSHRTTKEDAVDLKPLVNSGDVTPAQFRTQFQDLVSTDLLDRAVVILTTLGSRHSFSVANMLHLGLQKGIAAKVVEELEKWCEIFQNAPDPVTAHVDTKTYFDIMYGQYFMGPDDTINGLGPFVVVERRGNMVMKGIMPRAGKIWMP